jgi:hypothetical protein
MQKPALLFAATVFLLAAFALSLRGGAHDKAPQVQFQTSDRCFACHNGMKTKSGQPLDLGLEWQASAMANSARDPYWQAGVRRETIDHPESKAAIENECSICHMPVVHYEAKLKGRKSEVFAQIPFNTANKTSAAAADGVTCSVCHQIGPQGLGTPESYVGNFAIDPPKVAGDHAEYGPYAIAGGQQRIMQSSSGGFQPLAGKHIVESGICGSCHTLITRSLVENGKEGAQFFEQMPFPEWEHSGYANNKSCQSCHMPVISEPAQISSVLGIDREGVAHHTFVGGNFLLSRTMEKYGKELGAAAQPEQFQQATKDAIEFLQSQSARVTLGEIQRQGDTLRTTVTVHNLTGHKLPTAYPSRRAWLHFVVRDAGGKAVFESGKLREDGSIVGNDNDDDPLKFEPYYRTISHWNQVEIFEDIMQDQSGKVTTGLLRAASYLKDSRVLPAGFDKQTAPANIAVVGDAAGDPNFAAGQATVEYSVWVGNAPGPLKVEAELWYQPVGFRWAHNLLSYNAMEPQRYVRYYNSLAKDSALILAHASAQH